MSDPSPRPLESPPVPAQRTGARAAGLDLPEGLAYHDPLTGLYNRRLLDLLFAEHWAELAPPDAPVSLILLDLDGFKEVNDTYGHVAGDRVLTTAGRRLAESFRDTDLLVRFGGDEFVVVLPGVGGEEAGTLAERARQALAAERLQGGEPPLAAALTVSLSLGCATSPADGASGPELLHVADQRMYAEKRLRRQMELPAARRARRRARWITGLVGLGLLGLAGIAARQAWAPASEPLPAQDVTTSADLARRIGELQFEVERLSTELAAERAAQAPGTSNARISDLERTIAGLREQLTTSEGQQRAALPAAEPRPAPTPAAPTPAGAPAAMSPGVETSAPAPEQPRAPAAEAPPPPAVPSVLEPPVLVEMQKPRYPALPRDARREAVVELRVRVDASGRVVWVEPVGTRVGLGFEEAARDAALGARYRPGRRDGQPVEMEARLTVVFKVD